MHPGSFGTMRGPRPGVLAGRQASWDRATAGVQGSTGSTGQYWEVVAQDYRQEGITGGLRGSLRVAAQGHIARLYFRVGPQGRAGGAAER
jgi:hypothetical protein